MFEFKTWICLCCMSHPGKQTGTSMPQNRPKTQHYLPKYWWDRYRNYCLSAKQGSVTGCKERVMLHACPLPRVKTASGKDNRNMTGLMAKRKQKHTKHSIMIEAGQVLTSLGCSSWTSQDTACREQGMSLPPMAAQHGHALSAWQGECREAMPWQINVLPLLHAGNWS